MGNKNKLLVSQLGQTLIETLVALSTIVIIVTAITYAVITSLTNAEFSKSQNTATQSAQQAMEIIRSMRNNNYATFASLTGSYCMASDCTTLTTLASDKCGPKSNRCGQNVGIFVREVALEQNSSGCGGVTKATTTVSWADSKCISINNPFCHQVTLTSCFSDFGIEPTP